MIGKQLQKSEKSIAAIFVSTIGVTMVTTLSIALIAIMNPAVLYQGAVLMLLPLVILSLGMSASSVALSFKSIQGKAGDKSEACADLAPSAEPATSPRLRTDIAPSPREQTMLIAQPSAGEMFLQRALKASKEHGLTQRETEVLELLLQGRNAERIAQTLVISRHTAKTHIYNIYRKVGSTSQQELIDLFQERVSELDEEVAYARPLTRGLRAS